MAAEAQQCVLLAAICGYNCRLPSIHPSPDDPKPVATVKKYQRKSRQNLFGGWPNLQLHVLSEAVEFAERSEG